MLRRADALFAPDSEAWRVNGDVVAMMIMRGRSRPATRLARRAFEGSPNRRGWRGCSPYRSNVNVSDLTSKTNRRSTDPDLAPL